MNSKTMRKLMPVFAAVAMTTPFAAVADANNDVMEEIVVQGRYLSINEINSVKTPTPVLDVPQSLSIVTADRISKQGFTSVADIVNYVPGVNNSQGEGHRDSVVFRGVRSTADFYVDGARDDVQYYRPLYNLEQVEILRGPNALLFGRGGTGGIINRVTKKGVMGEQFTDFKVSAGSFGDYGFEIDTNYALGDRAALRVNAFYDELENHRDFFDGDRVGVNPTLRIALTPATTLDLAWEYIDHERFIDRGIPTDERGEPVEAFDDTTFGDAADNFTTMEGNVLRAALQHEFNEQWKGNVNLSYGDYEKTYQNYYPSDYESAAVSESGIARVEIDGYVDNTERTNLVFSSNLVGEFDVGSTQHTFVAGFEYVDTSSDQDRFNTVWDANGDDQIWVNVVGNRFSLRNGVLRDPMGAVVATNTGFGINGFGDGFGANATTAGTDLNDRTLVDIETTSFYVQDEIALTEQFLVVLGARYDQFDIDVNNVDPNAGDNAGRRSRKDDVVSPRAGLIFKPQENISAYLSYSESFLPRSGEQFANINGDADDLDPDEFENLEIGIKWDINPTLSLTAAYFQNDQTRAVRNESDDGTFNVDGLEIDGFEVQLQGNLTEQLSFVAGYSHLDGETDNGAEEPRELPENTFAAWLNYEVTQDFGFGLGVSYQDESFTSDFDIGGNSSTHPTLPSYTKVDASVYYNISDAFRLQLNLENLTDELYFPNSHTNNNVTVGESINARLSLTGRF